MNLKKFLFPTTQQKKDARRKTKRKKSESVFAKVLFVDPGLGGTGFAYFDHIVTGGTKPEAPKKFDMYSSKITDWEKKSLDVALWFESIFFTLKPNHVILEFPEFWEMSLKSNTAVRGGGLFKLAYLTGTLGMVSFQRTKKEPTLIAPRDWKGQLPKDSVKRRIQLRFPQLEGIRDHETDAIGMGLSAQDIL